MFYKLEFHKRGFRGWELKSFKVVSAFQHFDYAQCDRFCHAEPSRSIRVTKFQDYRLLELPACNAFRLEMAGM